MNDATPEVTESQFLVACLCASGGDVLYYHIHFSIKESGNKDGRRNQAVGRDRLTLKEVLQDTGLDKVKHSSSW